MKNWFSYLFAFVFIVGSASVHAEIVNINKADAAAMQHYLAGIGEKKAESIVTYRTDNGDFKAIEDIMEVRGIGEGIFKKIESDISISEGVTQVLDEQESTDSKLSDETESTDDKVNISQKVEASDK